MFYTAILSSASVALVWSGQQDSIKEVVALILLYMYMYIKMATCIQELNILECPYRMYKIQIIRPPLAGWGMGEG